MALTKDDLQAIQMLLQPLQDDITDIKLQLNNIDSNIIKTRQQVLREVRRLNDITDITLDDIGRVDTKIEQHINDNKKHSA